MTDSNDKSNKLDIEKQQIGLVYARALLAACRSSGKEADVAQEFDSLIHDVLDKLPDLDRTLSSPRVDHEDKSRILENAFGKRMSDELLTFLKVVSAHGRLDCLRDIFTALRHLHHEQQGLVEVQMTTATTIDNSLVGELTQAMRGMLRSEVDMQYTVDNTLLGGLVVRVGDTVFDASVANRLKRLHAETRNRAFQDVLGSADEFME